MQHTIPTLIQGMRDDGLLYVVLSCIRVDTNLCCQKSENELMLVVNRSIYDTLRQLEKGYKCASASGELSPNQSKSFTAPVMISQSLYRMISLCTEYHKTLGCFDIYYPLR